MSCGSTASWPGHAGCWARPAAALIDADGVAPLRHADRRRARELRAANFQREAAAHHLLRARRSNTRWPPGAQDRLSWMIQLPAIVAADPALAARRRAA